MVRPRQKSALVFILKAFIPYSRENLMLSFKPNHFFNELEKVSRYERPALKQAFRRAQDRNLLTRANSPRLTKKGLRTLQPYISEKLNAGRLMVIFDIPEDISELRRSFQIC